MELDLDTIKQLVILLTEHKLDKLKIGELEICKTRHENVKVTDNSKNLTNNPILNEDELLFYSTSAPNRPSEQINPYLSPKLKHQE